MTAEFALARAIQRNETSAMRALFTADPVIARRFGIEARSAGGTICASAAHLRAQPDRAVALVGRAVAGTGLLWLSPHVGGLYFVRETM